MAGQTQSTRMARAIADLILERFPKATDGTIQSWAKTLGFNLGELTNLPE
jgi:DNA-binding MurR/RpiR family transcriptional regulator